MRTARRDWNRLAACLLFAARCAWRAGAGRRVAHVCECGAHPPGPPRDRTVSPYAGEPRRSEPVRQVRRALRPQLHPSQHLLRRGARSFPSPTISPRCASDSSGPIEPHPQQVFGLRMLHGAQFAVEEANARGGYGGKPFRLMLHNDYDNWQAKTVYGDDRPTDPAIWGSASNEAVKMVYDDQDWAIFGSISSESTHIALRVALRAEIPIVNSASTDPTIPETYIPWYFTDLQDDRVQSLHAGPPHLHRAWPEARCDPAREQPLWPLWRAQVSRCRAAPGPSRGDRAEVSARRHGLFARSCAVIRSSRADAIVLWADEMPAALHPEADARRWA